MIFRHARENFMNAIFQFPFEVDDDFSRFLNANLATAAAAACAARTLNPTGKQVHDHIAEDA